MLCSPNGDYTVTVRWKYIDCTVVLRLPALLLSLQSKYGHVRNIAVAETHTHPRNSVLCDKLSAVCKNGNSVHSPHSFFGGSPAP